MTQNNKLAPKNVIILSTLLLLLLQYQKSHAQNFLDGGIKHNKDATMRTGSKPTAYTIENKQNHLQRSDTFDIKTGDGRGFAALLREEFKLTDNKILYPIANALQGTLESQFMDSYGGTIPVGTRLIYLPNNSTIVLLPNGSKITTTLTRNGKIRQATTVVLRKSNNTQQHKNIQQSAPTTYNFSDTQKTESNGLTSISIGAKGINGALNELLPENTHFPMVNKASIVNRSGSFIDSDLHIVLGVKDGYLPSNLLISATWNNEIQGREINISQETIKKEKVKTGDIKNKAGKKISTYTTKYNKMQTSIATYYITVEGKNVSTNIAHQ